MNKMTKAAIAAAAATAAVGLSMGPAAATAGPITVTGGGAFTASATNVLLTAGVQLTCATASASGTINAGSYTTPATIGHITSTTWGGCKALGLNSTVTQTGTWDIVATDQPVGGVTQGTISNVNATINVGGICTVTVTGSASGSFDNATQHLTLDGVSGLSIATSGLCVGVTSPGHFTADYAVSAASPVTIS